MSNKIIPESIWETDLYRLGPWEAAQGGGKQSPLNIMLQKLANRAEYLKNQADGLSGGGGSGSAGGGGAPGPSAVATGSLLDKPRHFHTAVPLPNAQTFVLGGYDGSIGAPSSITGAVTLDELTSTADIANSAILFGKDTYRAGAAYNPITNEVITSLGEQPTFAPDTKWVAFNLSSGLTSTITAATPVHRAGMVVFCPDGNIRLCGGVDNLGTILTSRWLYQSGSWSEEIAFLPGPPLFGADHVVDSTGNVYFFGGYTAPGTNNFDVWKTDSDLSNPVIIGTLADGASQPVVATPETRVSATLLNPGRAAICINNEIFSYDLVTNVQTPLLTLPIGVNNVALTPASGGNVLATGGTDDTGAPINLIHLISGF